MKAERIAIDNEFQSAVLIDDLRATRLLQTCMVHDHPVSNFFNGNLISLEHNVDKQNIDIRDRVKTHWDRFYSSEIMTSVVYAPLPLNEIQESVLPYLNIIPSKKNSSQYCLNFPWTNIFDKDKFLRLFKVKTIKSAKILTLSWVTPPQIKLYKTKPLQFLAFILGHEGEGSLFSYLKTKNYVYKLAAGPSPDGTLYNSHFSVFQILERIFKEVAVQSYMDFMFSHLVIHFTFNFRMNHFRLHTELPRV
ncbi:hypothetical protein MXB_1213 [Myxobolus squamalis]|nr:hypothetical protein MXB_1213 [Myxobolus squamalis]